MTSFLPSFWRGSRRPFGTAWRLMRALADSAGSPLLLNLQADRFRALAAPVRFGIERYPHSVLEMG